MDVVGIRLVLSALLYFFLIYPNSISAWSTDELELFDIVEEVNQNFYEVLGVDQSATSAEIRKAYRKLSLQLHPDKNKEEDAEVKFRQLVSVYEVLKDEEKRKNYELVLVNGLPDWKQPVYYYRRVRKLGLVELAVLLVFIFTIGHFIVLWAIFLEKRFEMEEVFRGHRERLERKSKKKKKGASEDELDDMLHETLQTVPKPKFTDLLPFTVGRCLISGITSLPALLNAAKELVKKEPEPEPEPESSDEEEAQRHRRRQRVDPMPDFTPELVQSTDKPVVYMDYQVKKTETEEKNHTVKKSGSGWDDDDLALLAKAVAKFPGGTSQRWEKIADMVGRPVSEVTKMSKQLKSECARSVDPSAQGLTGIETLKIKKGDPMSQNTITEDVRHFDSTAPEEVEAKRRSRPNKVPKTAEHMSQNGQSETAATAYVPSNATCSEGDNLEIQDTGAIWTQNQQKTLEWAIKQYPKGTPERWEKIAEHITGKAKDECIARFKYLADVVKKRKLQAAS